MHENIILKNKIRHLLHMMERINEISEYWSEPHVDIDSEVKDAFEQIAQLSKMLEDTGEEI